MKSKSETFIYYSSILCPCIEDRGSKGGTYAPFFYSVCVCVCVCVRARTRARTKKFIGTLPLACPGRPVVPFRPLLKQGLSRARTAAAGAAADDPPKAA
jgi:hypothetical protein